MLCAAREYAMNKQCIYINDAALGQWALEVYDVCKMGNGYAFEGYKTATDLLTGEVCTDEQFLYMLAEFALEEGYVEQNTSAQCAVLYEKALA